MSNLQQTSDKARVVELVLAAQRGDRAAFGELFVRFEQHVLNVAERRLGNRAEAEELAQDVFVQALQKVAQLREPECFGGWLRQITVRMAINRAVRRGPVTTAEPETLEATCVETRDPVSQAMGNESTAQLRAGLSRLRELDRQTLEAFYVQGRSLLEMSDQFDAPLGTIKRRLHVARKRLAKEVESLVAV